MTSVEKRVCSVLETYLYPRKVAIQDRLQIFHLNSLDEIELKYLLEKAFNTKISWRSYTGFSSAETTVEELSRFIEECI